MEKLEAKHPFLTGNYAPIQEEVAMQECFFEGVLPVELVGGMYIRNGSNPSGALDSMESKPYHWFDGDGMLHGVYFSAHEKGIKPHFVNRYVLTDILLASSPTSSPILPSIATLLGPLSSIHLIVYAILRCVFHVFLSFFTAFPIRHISVSNTSIFWHDGRALAGCESGPLNWIRLPALETVGWWDLEGDRGEVGVREAGGALGWMKEWTTAHPKRDPVTGELLLFHSTMLPPFLFYSVIPASSSPVAPKTPRILSAPVPISAPRMMHDFAASSTHTVLLDLPLSLNPLNLAINTPVVSYSPTTPSRFGLLPRHSPSDVRWYTASSCIIFHTSHAFNTFDKSGTESFNLVCCRMNSSRLIYAAGNLATPASQLLAEGLEDTCVLYYYRFQLSPPPYHPSNTEPTPSHTFPLSVIPFEFPIVPHEKSMSNARYVYGCSMRDGAFSAALGKAAKIDCLVKVDVRSLIARGVQQGNGEEDAVDQRTVRRILAQQEQEARSDIRIFALPPHHFAQEPSFVPKREQLDEDDGWLLTYVFDERQLDECGEPKKGARSELWVIDAKDMATVVAKVKLPQRVPYGLHGNFFSRDQVEQQRDSTGVRTKPS